MPRLLLLVTFFCLLNAACNRKDNSHLPPKQMEQVMLDISMAESYSVMARDNAHPPGTKNTDSLAAYYQQVFAHHRITQEQFKASLGWYKTHPEELDSLYSRISAEVDKTLEVENKKLRAIPGAPQVGK